MSISAPRYGGSVAQRTGRLGRVLAIVSNELEARAGWGTYALVGLSYLAIVLIIVIDSEFTQFTGGVTLSTLHAPYSSPIWPYLVLIVATAVGAGSIADDLGSRSITLYLARPIHLTDYLAAKTLGVGFWIGVAAVGPGVVGVSIAAGLGLFSASIGFEAVGAFLAIGLLTTVFFTALGLSLSSFTTRALYAGVGIFGVTLSLNIATAAVQGATGNSSVVYASPINDLLTAAEAAFQTGAATPTEPATSVAILLAASVLLFVAAWFRLSRVEVVGE